MIDLRKKSLPDTITVDGRDYLIKTDFRDWIKFSDLIETNRPLSEYLYLMVDDIPLSNFYPQLYEFYVNPNATPKATGSDKERYIDYIEDGEYIVAGFMQAYGIDLTKCDIHWHLFKALFVGLPDDTKIKQIMSMRAYKKDNKSYEAKCEELKKIWKLPQRNYKEAIEEANQLFYGAVMRK